MERMRRGSTSTRLVSRSAVLVMLVAAVLAPVSLPADAASGSAYRLTRVAKAASPIGVVWHPQTKAPYVVEQGGRVRPITAGKVGAPVLDVSKEVSHGGEQGLLGAAFANDGSKLFVNLTNGDGDTEIREYAWVNKAADRSSSRLLLTVDQPYGNHNGGGLAVDEKGLLWIGLGDGGSSGDPENRAQNLDSLLGKMLRIDPTPAGSKPYSIPDDNPFASGGGKPEIWAYGLRNPWRFDLDQQNDRLFIGDVGQNAYEEINAVALDRPGVNYGWKLREGKHAYDDGKAPEGAVDPVYEYPHDDGCSVTGGVVYRGKKLRGLDGVYLFGDYCKGWIALLNQRDAGNPETAKWSSRRLGITVSNLSSLNRAPDGEVWVTSTSGQISQISSR